jgi:hypothetical protein
MNISTYTYIYLRLTWDIVPEFKTDFSSNGVLHTNAKQTENLSRFDDNLKF